MYGHQIFRAFFILLTLLAVLHSFALSYSLYWIYWWFDLVTHFLGGVVVGLFTLWFFFYSSYTQTVPQSRRLVTTIIGIIVIGVGWEVFEFMTGLSIEDNFASDTIIDVCMDVLGALVAYLFVTNMFSLPQYGEE